MSENKRISDKEFKNQLQKELDKLKPSGLSRRLDEEDLRYLDLMVQLIRSNSRMVTIKEPGSSKSVTCRELDSKKLDLILSRVYGFLHVDPLESLSLKDYLKLVLSKITDNLPGLS